MSKRARRLFAVSGLSFTWGLIALGCSQSGVEESLGERSDQATLAVQPADKTSKSAQKAAGTLPEVAWVLMKKQGNLTTARATKDWKARGKAVAGELQTTAQSGQASVSSFLASRKAKVRSFWIVNALRVQADHATIEQLKSRSDVAKVVPERVFAIPPTKAGAPVPRVSTAEWGIDNVRAPQVWEDFGVRGEGIVVANIDTGVEFNHPALEAQYRGTTAPGVYDHNYNWYDPTGGCTSAPCDETSHGTHTMGTMVGDGAPSGETSIGVAPGARWIAARGCGSWSCTTEDLLAAAQWVLAPTDLNGQNPRPDLRPNIVNNSWGGGQGDLFFQAAVQAWIAAGIFPSFSSGNSGPSCGSSNSPSDMPEAFAAGAYDSYGQIAYFSSRGPSVNGLMKPDLSGPGVSVRSSVPGGGYEYFDGTSMAAPHISGAVALLWSAAPSLLGDIDATREILGASAINVDDESCGGTAEDNNVYGEGRLDAYAAVEMAPRGPQGTVAGVVSTEDGTPIADADVVAHQEGLRDRSGHSGPDGAYHLRLGTGPYDLTAHSFGFLDATAAVTVSEGTTTVQDFHLTAAPSFQLSGHVTDAQGVPLANALVHVLGTPLPAAVTDADGLYTFPSVPQGDYQVSAEGTRCNATETLPVTLNAAATVDFSLAQRVDAWGYSCQGVPLDYISGEDVLANYGDDDVFNVQLPFEFPYYDGSYNSINVSVNGVVSMGNSGFIPYYNDRIPSPSEPNAAIYALWDDLYLDGTGSVRTAVRGTAPYREFAIEWNNVTRYPGTGEMLTFEIVLTESGKVRMNYLTGGSGNIGGLSATTGIEDRTGLIGLQYSYNEEAITPGLSVEYSQPPFGRLSGTVLDQNDGLPVVGAIVRGLVDGAEVRFTQTDAAGHYTFTLPVDSYVIEAGGTNYGGRTATVSIEDGDAEVLDFTLPTGRAEVSPPTLQLTVPVGQSRSRTISIANSGSAALDWNVRTSGGRRQTVTTTRGVPKSPNWDVNAKSTRGLFGAAATPRGWAPNAVGDVLSSFTPSGVGLAWGVGNLDNLWLSDVFSNLDVEFDVSGNRTGRQWPTSWAGGWPADMARDSGRGQICQVDVGGDNGIHCFDPNTGAQVDQITGSFPWSSTSQRGLAYREDDDTFYIGGWNEGIIYHVKGLSYPDKGAVISSCSPADGSISGLAWNSLMGVLWVSTNSPDDTVYEINGDDCTVLSSIAHPSPGYNGAGLELDEEGNIWMIGQSPNTAYLVESGVPDGGNVSWMTVSPTQGTIGVGGSQNISVQINTAGLTPGLYLASINLQTTGAKTARIRVPVSVLVPAYAQAVNVGGANYTDPSGDSWAADQAYRSGGWGYVQRGKVASTNREISGTTDQPLFRSQRVDPYAYRFDSVPNGVYEVELNFAEFENVRPGKRLFDVIIEDTVVLPAHDIRYEVGRYAAESRKFFVPVSDGRVDVRLVQHGGTEKPVINALRVTHRPDR